MTDDDRRIACDLGLCEQHGPRSQASGEHAERAERVIRAHAVEVRARMIAELRDDATWAELVELAVDRATGQGVEEYGSASFDRERREPGAMRAERHAEHADAIFYGAVEIEGEPWTFDVCTCGRSIRRIILGGRWEHADGRTYRHLPTPR